LFDPNKKPFTIFKRHWFTGSKLMVSPDQRYEITVMVLFNRVIGAHLLDTNLGPGATRCLSPNELIEFLAATSN